MAEIIEEWVPREELEKYMSGKKLFGQPDIDERLPIEKRLEQPISYRYIWTIEKINEYMKKFNKSGKLRIADIGCWTGMMSYLLKKDHNVIAIDNNQEYLDQINKHSPTVRTLNSDILELDKLNLERDIDIVIMLEVIEHIKEDTLVLKQAYKLLKYGGMMVVTTPIEKNLLTPEHVNFYDYFKLVNLFSTVNDNFKICKLNKFSKKADSKNIWGIIMYKE